jgi:hypothetical protein
VPMTDVDARRAVLRSIAAASHDLGRAAAHVDSVLAREWRRMGDRAWWLETKGSPAQLAAFFGALRLIDGGPR